MSITHQELFEADVNFLDKDLPIPFDVFIKVSDRLIKIIECNETAFKATLEKIKNKRVTKVLIKNTDQMAFIKFGLNSPEQSSTEKRIKTLIQTTNQIFKSLEKDGITSQNCIFLKEAATEIVYLIRKDNSLASFLGQIQSESLLFSHSLLRTLLCLSAAKNLDWKSDYSLNKITLASLFCDLSLKSDFTMSLRDKNLRSEEQQNVYLNHMHLTVSEISRCMNLPQDVGNAILHHHEFCDGSGPLGVTKLQIHPLGHLIRIGDEIAMRLIKSIENPHPLPLSEILVILKNHNKFNQQITKGYNFLK